MAQSYTKHLVVIKDRQYDLGDNFTIEYDLENIYINCSFSFPYVQNDLWNTKDLQAYDAVKIYVNYFDDNNQAENASIEDLIKIFDGYIEGQPLQLNKGSGYEYQIKCKSRMGLSYERSIRTKFYSGSISTLLTRALDESGLNEWVSDFELSGIQPFFQVSIDSSRYLGEILEQIKKKYAIHIYETGDNTLKVKAPFFLSQQSSVEAYEYDVEDNVFNIDFGDKTNKVDTVVVVGSNTIGLAFDPIAYQLKYGTTVENLQNNISPDPEKLNIRFFYRRDFFSQEDCQEFARNKLVEFAKNNTISFDTILDPNQEISETFVIKNADKIPESQLWIIKKLTFNKAKGQLSANIVGYSNSIVDFPEDVLLSSTGILDTDILETTTKSGSTINIRE